MEISTVISRFDDGGYFDFCCANCGKFWCKHCVGGAVFNRVAAKLHVGIGITGLGCHAVGKLCFGRVSEKYTESGNINKTPIFIGVFL